MRLSPGFMRVTAAVLTFSMTLPSIASPMSALNNAAGRLLQDWLAASKNRPGPYSDRPLPVKQVGKPGKDNRHRGGIWSEHALADMALVNARFQRGHSNATSVEEPNPDWYATVEPAAAAQGLPHSLAVDPSAGSSYPWEGSAIGMAGSINTANGNKLTYVHLFGWQQRGGLNIDFTLMHNSETAYECELGKNWSWTFNNYVSVSGSTATVHYGDAKSVPYTAPGGGTTGGTTTGGSTTGGSTTAGPSVADMAYFGTTYIAPAGIYDVLVKNTDNTWSLTRKDQRVYHFNTSGYLTSIVDRNGNTITFTVNSGGYCTKVTDATGRYYSFTLDSSSRYTTVADMTGRTWSFTYNSSDQLTTVTWPLLSGSTYTDQFSYDSSNRVLTHTDRRGNGWTATYNSDGSVATEVDPLTHTTSYAYTSTYTKTTDPLGNYKQDNYSDGLLTSRRDEAGFTDSRSYDTANRVITYVDKRGKSWVITWDSNGNMLTFKDPNLNTTTWTYNSINEPLTVTDPLSHQTVFTYDASGNRTKITDPLGRQTVFTFDTYGELSTSKTPLLHTTTLGYDSNGYINSVTDPLSDITAMVHDSLGRLTSATDPIGNVEQVAYDIWSRTKTFTHPDTKTVLVGWDAVNNVTSVTDENGHTTSVVFDSANRKTSVTNPRGDIESYGYDTANHRTSITNGNGKTRNYAFTARGEISTLTLPDSSVESWTRDAVGNVTGYTNPLNQTISYSYDNADRGTGITYATGPGVTFSFDNANRVTSMVDSTGTSSWTYDAADEVTGLNTPEGNMTYGFDSDRRRTSMVEAGVGTTSYVYDNANRLTSLTNPYSETTSWAYDADSRPTRQNYASGAYETWAYDNRSRPTGIGHYQSSGAPLTVESYVYDGAGNLSSKTVDSVLTSYGYDASDQITSENSPGYAASYSYDSNGNRLSKTLNGVTDTYTYDSADKLLTAGSKSYSYDAAGRATSMTNGSNVTTLSYDYEDRLTSANLPGGVVNTFTYNGLGTRIAKADSTGSYSFKRDGVAATDSVLGDGLAGFTPEVSEHRSGTSTFYHDDRLGSNVALTNPGQVETDSRSFDAYGSAKSFSGSNPTPFGFCSEFGYQEDHDTGFKLLGHRVYDPTCGRYITRDHAKDGQNWYSYAKNEPTKLVDPSGEIIPIIIVAVVIVFALSIDQTEEGGGWQKPSGFGADKLKFCIMFALLASGGEALDAVGAPVEPVPEPPVGNSLFRVVEGPEQGSLGETGGVPTPSPTGQEMKPFFTDSGQAQQYQGIIPESWGPTEIWQWSNEGGVGEIGPPVDGVPGPTWHVPIEDLPKLGPGAKLQ